MSHNIASRISRLERLRSQIVRLPRHHYPWLTNETEAKLAAATLDAVVLYEVTRDEPAWAAAFTLAVEEFAHRLRDDPAARWERLSEFGGVRSEAIPQINNLLDRIGYRGARIFPTELELYVYQRDHRDLGGRILRPWPPSVPREHRIKIPDRQS